jgi:hypothetical protein
MSAPIVILNDDVTHTCISGLGKYHTNDADASKPNKELTPYLAIGLSVIRALVDSPQQVDKARAQWLIPSSHPSRSHAIQEAQGAFWWLWADLDIDPLPLDRIKEIVESMGAFDYEIYTSHSAMEGNQKSRILIPLFEALSGADWMICQETLNDKLAAAGATPDAANLGCGQLCYLPNQGEFYDSRRRRGGQFFQPLWSWSDDIALKHKAVLEQEEIIRVNNVLAESKRSNTAYSNGHGSLIDAFNSAYTVEQVLTEAGYAQRGNTFRHPQSESGNYSASVENGCVHSLSSSDPLYTNGGGVGAHSPFGAFTVLFANGDTNKALRLAGDSYIQVGGESWNKVAQREYAKAQASTPSALTQTAPIPFARNVFALNEFMSEPIAPDFVWRGILRRGWLYALVANPGAGKTATALYLAMMMALGRTVHGRETKRSKILFMCGENPEDVRIRLEMLMIENGIAASEIEGQIFFTQRPFAIDDAGQREAFVREAMTYAPFDVVFADTLPAHSGVEEENDNAAMHALAMSVRELMLPIGVPCFIALMHPTKNAQEGDLLPRGGSSFTGSIDGVLCLWRGANTSVAKLFPHASKFRGAAFEPLHFELKNVDHPTIKDNFGYPAGSVIAVEAVQGLESEVNFTPLMVNQNKGGILEFVKTMTDNGDWIGVSQQGTTSNNIYKKSFREHDKYPNSLRGGKGVEKRIAFACVDALLSEGLLVREKRFAPNKGGTKDRDRVEGIWITDKAMIEYFGVNQYAEKDNI